MPEKVKSKINNMFIFNFIKFKKYFLCKSTDAFVIRCQGKVKDCKKLSSKQIRFLFKEILLQSVKERLCLDEWNKLLNTKYLLLSL